MSFTDRAKERIQEMAGAVKERIGDATDNERLRAEGASQQSTARAQRTEAGRDVRDAFDR